MERKGEQGEGEGGGGREGELHDCAHYIPDPAGTALQCP